ncbi:haloacid dehalogenase-like hydrolase [Variovorax paradoxus]|nr:haloacid dehalogenase-like hydrolase [Variovorax paradoxus]
MAATIGGLSRRELESAALQYATRKLPALIRPEMAVRIQEHKRRGHQLVLVSAAPTLYLTRCRRRWLRCSSRDRAGVPSWRFLRLPGLAELLRT